MLFYFLNFIYFRDEWTYSIRNHQTNIIPLKTVLKSKIWFEYLYNQDHPENSTYRCRLCYRNYDKFGLNKSHKSVLAFKEGVLKSTYKKNWDMIANHTSTKSHQSVIESLRELKRKRIRTDFDRIQKETERNELLKITAKMIRTVYVEIKANIPFISHPQIVLLQEYNDLNMGYHHYDRNSAFKMGLSISNHMHKTLVENLISQNKPISIIIDGSTDSSQQHFLIIYLECVEKNIPILYFYALIPTSTDESARGFFDCIIQKFDQEDEGFKKYIHENLVGYVSDGAHVMTGSRNGLIKYFRDFTKRPIYATHCMAHR